MKGKATERAAKKVGVGTRLVEMVKKVQNEAPELVEQISAGIFNITDANRLAGLPEAERKGVLRLGTGIRCPPENCMTSSGR